MNETERERHNDEVLRDFMRGISATVAEKGIRPEPGQALYLTIENDESGGVRTTLRKGKS